MVFLTAKEISSTHHEHVHLLSPSGVRVLEDRGGKEKVNENWFTKTWLTQVGGSLWISKALSPPSGCSEWAWEEGSLRIADVSKTPLTSCSGEQHAYVHTGPISVLWLPQWLFLFQGVIRDHVSKSRLWSQHAWAEIRAIPLISSVIFGKLLTFLRLNFVISK